MKEHPILFSDEMVRAILDGRKTQTRRPIKPPIRIVNNVAPKCQWLDCGVEPEKQRYGFRGPFSVGIKSPFGGPGDELWVRECWGFAAGNFDYLALRYRADNVRRIIPGKNIRDYPNKRGGMKPSIHMPRWASRITLEVTGVRGRNGFGISRPTGLRLRGLGVSLTRSLAVGTPSTPSVALAGTTTHGCGLWNSITRR